MGSYKDAYQNLTVIEDGSHGLVELDTISRHGQDRATKIRNNFIGHLIPAEPKLLLEILRMLNAKLPKTQENEVVVGMPTSGIIMSSALAQVRDSRYNFAVTQEFGDLGSVFSLTEDHRDLHKHYLYGVKPGDKVIIIEDEVTSGLGVTQLTLALTDFGANVIAIASVIETINFGAREHIKKATDHDLVSLVKVELS
jgi:adenine phosphoribosyltransferase